MQVEESHQLISAVIFPAAGISASALAVAIIRSDGLEKLLTEDPHARPDASKTEP